MDFDLFFKTLSEGYSAYVQILTWIFPYLDKSIIGALAAGSSVYFFLKVIGHSFKKDSKIDKKEFEENFVGPKYMSADDMVVANIRAILHKQPQPFSKEVIESSRVKK